MEREAKIVVGLGFGDEGKGITTDYLLSQAKSDQNPLVIRFSGGHQAGHTVQIGNKRHISASYGAGVLRGIPTYLSEYCCFYPPNMERERDIIGGNPILVIHPLAKLTTPYDVAFNRVRELCLKHGSCGMGIAATFQRNEGPHKLHAIDTLHPMVLMEKLHAIAEYYERASYEYRIKSKELNRVYKETVEVEMHYFHKAFERQLFSISDYRYLEAFNFYVFEGSQGILLDKDHGVFPNVTYANTTSKNAIAICNLLKISTIELFYVTRCYLTRHGNGWMPFSEINLINNENETNVRNDWQGNFRKGEIDYNLLNYAICIDRAYSYGHDHNVVVTCLDQRPDFVFDNTQIPFTNIYGSYSPDSKDFKRIY